MRSVRSAAWRRGCLTTRHCSLFSTLAAIGLPLLCSFVGEFMVLGGTLQTHPAWAIVAATGVIFSSCYMLWTYQRVFYGKITNPLNEKIEDVNGRERWVIYAMCVLMLWLGLQANFFLSRYEGSCQAILQAEGSRREDRGQHYEDDGIRTMIPLVDYIRILPEIVLTVFGMMIMLADPVLPPEHDKKMLGYIALAGVVAGLMATAIQAENYGDAFSNTVRVDTFSIFFHVVILLVALVVTLISFEYLEVQRIRSGEYYGLVLFGTVGMMLMSSAIELVLIFIALEISSISTYVLAGMRRRAAESAEASLKYFLLGSFATAFFLYGVAMVFGATGTTNIYGIAHYLQGAAFDPRLSWLSV